jgi:hypothetical protein
MTSSPTPNKRPPAFTERSFALLIRFRELLLEYDVAPTTLVDPHMAAALEQLEGEIRGGELKTVRPYHLTGEQPRGKAGP